MEQWLVVEDFPDYEVSDQGRVRNRKNKRIVRPFDNRRDTMSVNLYRDGQRYSRSLRRVVLNAFDPIGDRSDTSPIHLDCDYTNCAVDNLEWRPKWVAYEWTKQNRRGPIHTETIVDIDTNESWETVWHAARHFGTTEGMIYGTANNTNRFGEYVGAYKGRRLRFKHRI